MSKVIAITGAARGIGLATARALKEKGATVVIGDIDETAAKDAGERLGVAAFPVDSPRASRSPRSWPGPRRRPGRWTCWSTTPGSCRSAR
jgi:nucleoside-diphosphate-sugar epimerase